MVKIENIVKMSLIKLAKDFPKAAKEIKEKNYFITTIQDEFYKEYLIIDFTRKIDYNNQEDFMNHSSWLFSQFAQKESWYNV